jgi:hypothetical protein
VNSRHRRQDIFATASDAACRDFDPPHNIPPPSLPSSFYPTTPTVLLIANNSSTFTLSNKHTTFAEMPSHSSRISKRKKKTIVAKDFRKARVWSAEELSEMDSKACVHPTYL